MARARPRSRTRTIPSVERPPQPPPRATKPSEAAFLALGEGATRYLMEAAAVGARRLERKMAEAVTLAALHGADSSTVRSASPPSPGGSPKGTLNDPRPRIG